MPRNKKSLQEQIYLDLAEDSFSEISFDSEKNPEKALLYNTPFVLEPATLPDINLEIINSEDMNSKIKFQMRPELNPERELDLKTVVDNLKNLSLVPEEALFFYLDEETNMFVFIEDLPKKSLLRISQETKLITLKYRTNGKESKMSEQKNVSKRSTQRKIIEAIRLVFMWKKEMLVQGCQKGCAKSAFEIGVPKKTLDDYQLQLRLGKEFGFSFKENIQKDMSVLRTFVRNSREALPQNTPRNYKKCSSEFLLFLQDLLDAHNVQQTNFTAKSVDLTDSSSLDSEEKTNLTNNELVSFEDAAANFVVDEPYLNYELLDQEWLFI